MSEKVDLLKIAPRKRRAFHVEESKDEILRGCPCLYGDPCASDCTCVNRFSSAGCARCCSYGSPEQRAAKARALVRLGASMLVGLGAAEVNAYYKVVLQQRRIDELEKQLTEAQGKADLWDRIKQFGHKDIISDHWFFNSCLMPGETLEDAVRKQASGSVDTNE